MKHLLLAAVISLTAGLARAADPPLRHSRAWVNQRLADMVACDEAYLYNEVLGGRAIHQNSMSKPEPTEAWEGNFHTQQQSYYALVWEQSRVGGLGSGSGHRPRPGRQSRSVTAPTRPLPLDRSHSTAPTRPLPLDRSHSTATTRPQPLDRNHGRYGGN